MSDKSMPERMVAVEKDIASLREDVDAQVMDVKVLKNAKAERDGRIVKEGWHLIKLGGIFLALTFLTDMVKKGCTGCQALLDLFGSGGNR